MSRAFGRAEFVPAILLALATAAALAGCGRSRPPRTHVHWTMVRPEPRFDPHGPPDPARAALERLLTKGLVEEDDQGRVVPAAADRVDVSADGRTVTFGLAPDLRFTDGTSCTSADFRRALLDGLARTDHATFAWLFAAVKGVDRVRPGKPLPRDLGITTPDSTTLVLALARADSTIVRKLALPGVSGAWSRKASGTRWDDAAGLGPYRVARVAEDRTLTLARVDATEGRADTITLQYRLGVPRALAILRARGTDLMWPVPPGLISGDIGPEWRTRAEAARPVRRLLLVQRADVPPTSRIEARRALAQGVNREEVSVALGPSATPLGDWPSGGGTFAFPPLDRQASLDWMERGGLGRSFHVRMAYDQDGPAETVARLMQGEWSSIGIYVELVPLRGDRLAREMAAGISHLGLAPWQPPLEGAAAELAGMVMPLRGPAVGGVRTGWRTREFDPWIAARGTADRTPPLDAAAARDRLEQELVALPLATLPWVWIEPAAGARVPVHPRYGPDPSRAVTAASTAR